jgi:uncharacterized protein YutE (UPF0331/DUF86 family)
VVLARLTLLRDEMVFLKQERDTATGLQDYSSDARLRRAVERSLQVAIEACLDIGRRIISQESLRYPADNREVFTVLAEAGIVGKDLLPELHRMAGFRNLLVHDYARLDNARVYTSLSHQLGTFDRFALAVRQHLDG